jgi:arsenate reductase (glutaredoxin)
VRETGAEVIERDYAREPLTEDEIRAVVRAAGVATALNTRHAVAKERGWKERPPTEDELVRAALAEPNLLRRPILLRDGRAVVGKDAGAIRALLA